MPSKVKKRWIERQKARGHHKFVEHAEPEVGVYEPVVDEVVEPVEEVEEVVESTDVEGGTVTDVEVVDDVIEPVVKKKKTKKQ